MDSEMRAYLRSLTKEQREIISDRRKSYKERAKEAKVGKGVVKAYEKWEQERREFWVGAFCIGIISTFLGAFYHMGKEIFADPYPRKPTSSSSALEDAVSDQSTVVQPVLPRSLSSAVSKLEHLIEHQGHIITIQPFIEERTARDLFFYETYHPGSPIDAESDNHIFPLFHEMSAHQRSISAKVPIARVLEDFLASGGEKTYSLWHHPETDQVLLHETFHARPIINGCLDRLGKGTISPQDYQVLDYLVDHNVLLQRNRLHANVVRQLVDENKQQHGFIRSGVIQRMMSYYQSHSNLYHAQSHRFVPRLPTASGAKTPCQFIGYLHNHNWGRLESAGDLENSKEQLSLVLVYGPTTRTFTSRHLYGGVALGGKQLESSVDERDSYHRAFVSHPNNRESRWSFEMNSEEISPQRPRLDFSLRHAQGIDFALYLDAQGTVFNIQHFSGDTRQRVQYEGPIIPSYIMLIPRSGRPYVQKVEVQ